MLRLKWGVVVATPFAVVARASGGSAATAAAVTVAAWRSRLSAGVVGCPIAGASPVATKAPGATPIWLRGGAPTALASGP